jgi:hypothetical protein
MRRAAVAVWIGCFVALLPSGDAFASGGDRVPGSRYVSGRGAALGDAYIGFADTISDALFYNPAGLGRVKDPTFEPVNIQIQANSKLSSLFSTDVYKIQSLSGYESKLLANPNTNPGGGFAVLPALGFRGFGVGMLYQSRLMAESDGTNIRYRSTYQLIPAAGFGLRLASGVLRIGYSLQWVNQASGDITVPAGTQPMGWNQGLAQGSGFSHNAGFALTLPYVYHPTVNVVVRNIGGLRYSSGTLMSLAKNPSGVPDEEKMTIDASVGFTYKMGSGWSLGTQYALRDSMNASNTRILVRGAVGMELSASDVFFARIGYGSGYPSAGLGFRTPRAEANLAWFSEEIGDGGSAKSRDIRYLFQILFRAF